MRGLSFVATILSKSKIDDFSIGRDFVVDTPAPSSFVVRTCVQRTSSTGGAVTGAVVLPPTNLPSLPRRRKFRLIDSRRAIFAFPWKHLTANCHMFGSFNTPEGDKLLSALAPPRGLARAVGNEKEKTQAEQVALRANFKAYRATEPSNQSHEKHG